MNEILVKHYTDRFNSLSKTARGFEKMNRRAKLHKAGAAAYNSVTQLACINKKIETLQTLRYASEHYQ